MIVDKLGFVGICVCMRESENLNLQIRVPEHICATSCTYLRCYYSLPRPRKLRVYVSSCIKVYLYVLEREGRHHRMCVCDIKLTNHVVSSSSNTVSEYSERQDKVDVPGRRVLVNEVRNNQTD